MKFTCKLCGQVHKKGKIRIKDGHICETCYNGFSPALQESARKLATHQIKKINGWYYPREEIPFATYELLGIGVECIQIGNKEILLKDIESAKLRFHPDGRFINNEGAVSGILTVRIKIKNHSVYIEESIVKDWVYMKYTITDNSIKYHYPKILQDIFDDYAAIFSGVYSNAMVIYDRLYDQNKKTTHHTSKTPKPNPALEKAMKLFNVKQPFTKTEIEKIKKNLQKKFHPDAGGTSSQFIEINNAYEILKKYAK